MATYKMLKTHRGVKAGDVHSVVFHEGKTYEIDDDLAGQFNELEIIEPSSEEVSTAENEEGREDLHENWLDTDPAVMRHGELTPKEIVQKDESPLSDDVADDSDDDSGDEGDEEGDDKPEGEKKARKARKSAPENK